MAKLLSPFIERAIYSFHNKKSTLPKIARAQIIKFSNLPSKEKPSAEATLSDKTMYIRGIFTIEAIDDFEKAVSHASEVLDLDSITGGIVFLKDYKVVAHIDYEMGVWEHLLIVQKFVYIGSQGSSQFGSDLVNCATHSPFQIQLKKHFKLKQISQLCMMGQDHSNPGSATQEERFLDVNDVANSLLARHQYVFIPQDQEKLLDDIPEWSNCSAILEPSTNASSFSSTSCPVIAKNNSHIKPCTSYPTNQDHPSDQSSSSKAPCDPKTNTPLTDSDGKEISVVAKSLMIECQQLPSFDDTCCSSGTQPPCTADQSSNTVRRYCHLPKFRSHLEALEYLECESFSVQRAGVAGSIVDYVELSGTCSSPSKEKQHSVPTSEGSSSTEHRSNESYSILQDVSMTDLVPGAFVPAFTSTARKSVTSLMGGNPISNAPFEVRDDFIRKSPNISKSAVTLLPAEEDVNGESPSIENAAVRGHNVPNKRLDMLTPDGIYLHHDAAFDDIDDSMVCATQDEFIPKLSQDPLQLRGAVHVIVEAESERHCSISKYVPQLTSLTCLSKTEDEEQRSKTSRNSRSNLKSPGKSPRKTSSVVQNAANVNLLVHHKELKKITDHQNTGQNKERSERCNKQFVDPGAYSQHHDAIDTTLIWSSNEEIVLASQESDSDKASPIERQIVECLERREKLSDGDIVLVVSSPENRFSSLNNITNNMYGCTKTTARNSPLMRSTAKHPNSTFDVSISDSQLVRHIGTPKDPASVKHILSPLPGISTPMIGSTPPSSMQPPCSNTKHCTLQREDGDGCSSEEEWFSAGEDTSTQSRQASSTQLCDKQVDKLKLENFMDFSSEDELPSLGVDLSHLVDEVQRNQLESSTCSICLKTASEEAIRWNHSLSQNLQIPQNHVPLTISDCCKISSAPSENVGLGVNRTQKTFTDKKQVSDLSEEEKENSPDDIFSAPPKTFGQPINITEFYSSKVVAQNRAFTMSKTPSQNYSFENQNETSKQLHQNNQNLTNPCNRERSFTNIVAICQQQEKFSVGTKRKRSQEDRCKTKKATVEVNEFVGGCRNVQYSQHDIYSQQNPLVFDESSSDDILSPDSNVNASSSPLLIPSPDVSLSHKQDSELDKRHPHHDDTIKSTQKSSHSGSSLSISLSLPSYQVPKETNQMKTTKTAIISISSDSDDESFSWFTAKSWNQR